MSDVLSFQVSGSNPSKVGGTGTTVKYFPRPLGPSIGVAPATPSSTSAVGALLLPAQNVFNGQSFTINVAGSVGAESGDPSGTVHVDLYAVTGSVSSPTYTALGGTATLTPTRLQESFSLEFKLSGDTVSGFLTGQYSGIFNGAYSNTAGTTNWVILANNISGLDFNVGNSALAQGAVLGFVVGVTFGTSDATNTASLYQFGIKS